MYPTGLSYPVRRSRSMYPHICTPYNAQHLHLLIYPGEESEEGGSSDELRAKKRQRHS